MGSAVDICARSAPSSGRSQPSPAPPPSLPPSSAQQPDRRPHVCRPCSSTTKERLRPSGTARWLAASAVSWNPSRSRSTNRRPGGVPRQGREGVERARRQGGWRTGCWSRGSRQELSSRASCSLSSRRSTRVFTDNRLLPPLIPQEATQSTTLPHSLPLSSLSLSLLSSSLLKNTQNLLKITHDLKLLHLLAAEAKSDPKQQPAGVVEKEEGALDSGKSLSVL